MPNDTQQVQQQTTQRKRSRAFRTIGVYFFLSLVTIFVLCPIWWVLTMAIDARGLDTPIDLNLIPPQGITFDAFQKVLFGPYKTLCSNPSDESSCMYFIDLLKNSLFVALGTSLFSVILGASAAYAFSRFRFIGRQVGMLGFIVLLMIPSTGTMAPLYVLLSSLKFPGMEESLRTTLIGLSIAYSAGALPFAIWNLKGYFDTIPKELEEAALIDGCSPTQAFVRVVLPLSLPALAVTILFGFMASWTEFGLAWLFLEKPSRFTLAMAIRSMQGEFTTPWAQFAALAIMMSLPIVILFFVLQKWLVGGLTVGGVKG